MVLELGHSSVQESRETGQVYIATNVHCRHRKNLLWTTITSTLDGISDLLWLVTNSHSSWDEYTIKYKDCQVSFSEFGVFSQRVKNLSEIFHSRLNVIVGNRFIVGKIFTFGNNIFVSTHFQV